MAGWNYIPILLRPSRLSVSCVIPRLLAEDVIHVYRFYHENMLATYSPVCI